MPFAHTETEMPQVVDLAHEMRALDVSSHPVDDGQLDDRECHGRDGGGYIGDVIESALHADERCQDPSAEDVFCAATCTASRDVARRLLLLALEGENRIKSADMAPYSIDSAEVINRAINSFFEGGGYVEETSAEDRQIAELRRIREEQDAAFEDAMRADAEKEDRAAQEMRRKKEEEARARDEADHIRSAISDRRRVLEEHDQRDENRSAEDRVRVAVRFPGGERFVRGFRTSDPLLHLFYSVDTSDEAEKYGGALVPGAYDLVLTHPRREFFENTASGSLYENGIRSCQGEVVFVQPR